MIVREIVKKDVPALARLAQDTYAESFGKTLSKSELRQALKDRSEAYFYSLLGKEIILVAEDKNTLTGFIQFGEVRYDSVKTTKNDIELNKIYVKRPFQGKGVGRKLMEAMITHPRMECVENIYLDVFAENEKAIRFYKKYGFKVVGKVPFKADGKTIGFDLLMKKIIMKL